MPVDKGGAGREQARPSDWERIDTEWEARAKAQRDWDATHDPSEEFEKAARPLPPDYGKDRPATRLVRPDQAEEMVELWGQAAFDRLIASGRIVVDSGDRTDTSGGPDTTAGSGGATDQPRGGERESASDDAERRGTPDTGADAPAISDTKAAIDAAYATGDPDTIARALREALARIEGRPERQTTWQTIAEEMGGEVKSFPTYEAAKRALGAVPGTEIHHVVEQAQAKPERSGFDLSRINATDNLARIPPEVHREISKHYSRTAPGLGVPLRDVLNGTSWEYQFEVGREAVDKQMKEYGDER